ncbi:MAG: RNA polymerase sigma factor [Planctomycetota bacterium]|jgi:RNA polymerase sigma-70 factor (ECF subfamily)
MEDTIDYIALVQQSRLGDRESLNRLAKLAGERLRVYVYRLVLDEDATQDIVQESTLEMLKILGKLKKAEKFWPWLYGIAFNKIHRHHRELQRRYRKIPGSVRGYGSTQKDEQEGVANLVSEELRQIVSGAMRQLKTQHRAVLTMRCYDAMSYSEIGESIGCSEFAAKMLFLRAKRSLQRQLSRRGLGRGALLTALVLFGKMTAPSEAAAAKVTVTAGSIKVGATAGLAGIATSKAVILPLATAGVVAVGTMVATSGPEGSLAVPAEKQFVTSPIAGGAERSNKSIDEYWYYYPSKVPEAVMMRLMQSGRCVVRQNESGNYYFEKRSNAIYIENYRPWHEDLSVWRLPTDSLGLREFLPQVEGRAYETEYVPGKGNGLLVIAKREAEGNGGDMRTTYQYNVLDEEYFRYNLPTGAKIVDNRDAMHERGWTYFRIKGKVNGQMVDGTGRIPFVYEGSLENRPWLRLRVGRKQLIDAGGVRLFKGLGRPWAGLHTIDTVRRDAAEKKIAFETRLISAGTKAEVTLATEKGGLRYIIDMDKDIVERIIYTGESQGELVFTYLQEIDDIGREFSEPRWNQGLPGKEAGIMWLIREINNNQK